MASILRQIVSGPRARHPEAGLDLCYVTDNIVVTSGPSSVWPRKAYRNPISQLVAFLDRKHGDQWAIFEFRAEGTGYPDSEVYGRVHHFPWPDHHPPPFGVVPRILGAMKNWLQGGGAEKEGKGKRVAVVHCKAGKGRSGTVSCAYLIGEEGWRREEALERFTVRRMRQGFGQGVSIPSQLRYVRYVDRWANEMGKRYVERGVEITEVHVWGLRDGVKVAVDGFVEEGKRIHTFHTFTRAEKTVVESASVPSKQAPVDAGELRRDEEMITSPVEGQGGGGGGLGSALSSKEYVGSVQTVILRPKEKLVVPTSDVNIDFERRNKASYAGFTMVTAVAHVWWNAWFEGGFEGHDSGIFEIDWDAMDGIKGSARKGVRAFDKLKVVWRYPEEDKGLVVEEPKIGEPVAEVEPADWKGEDSSTRDESAPESGLNAGRSGATALSVGAVLSSTTPQLAKQLGLRKADPASADVSKASSVKDEPATSSEVKTPAEEDVESDTEGVKPHGPLGEDYVSYDAQSHADGRHDTATGRFLEMGLAKTANIIAKLKSGDDSETKSSPAKVDADVKTTGAEQKDFAVAADPSDARRQHGPAS